MAEATAVPTPTAPSILPLNILLVVPYGSEDVRTNHRSRKADKPDGNRFVKTCVFAPYHEVGRSGSAKAQRQIHYAPSYFPCRFHD